MRTRIKETTKIVEGTKVIEYVAEVYIWHDSLSWYPARQKLNWMGYTHTMSKEAFAREFGPAGSLERAKKIIDKLLAVVAFEKQQMAKQKAVEKSKKIRYIKYP